MVRTAVRFPLFKATKKNLKKIIIRFECRAIYNVVLTCKWMKTRAEEALSELPPGIKLRRLMITVSNLVKEKKELESEACSHGILIATSPSTAVSLEERRQQIEEFYRWTLAQAIAIAKELPLKEQAKINIAVKALPKSLWER